MVELMERVLQFRLTSDGKILTLRFRDNLKSKELHIEMMRKKMHRLEEESNQRSALSVDRDDAILSLQVSLYNLFQYK